MCFLCVSRKLGLTGPQTPQRDVAVYKLYIYYITIFIGYLIVRFSFSALTISGVKVLISDYGFSKALELFSTFMSAIFNSILGFSTIIFAVLNDTIGISYDPDIAKMNGDCNAYGDYSDDIRSSIKGDNDTSDEIIYCIFYVGIMVLNIYFVFVNKSW